MCPQKILGGPVNFLSRFHHVAGLQNRVSPANVDAHQNQQHLLSAVEPRIQVEVQPTVYGVSGLMKCVGWETNYWGVRRSKWPVLDIVVQTPLNREALSSAAVSSLSSRQGLDGSTNCCSEFHVEEGVITRTCYLLAALETEMPSGLKAACHPYVQRISHTCPM